MFDFSQVLDFMRLGQGHGLIQSVLLFMIWWQGKGLRKELVTLRDSFSEAKSNTDKRFEHIEGRITVLETRGKINAIAVGST